MSRSSLFLCTILLLFCVACNTQTIIVNNVSEREANEIVVLLASRGIPAEKSEAAVAAGGVTTGTINYNVSVPSSQITDSLAILNQAGLPRVKGTRLLDLFGSQGLVPSDLQDKIRYQEGLSEQLATTIRKMDGIIDANVQITFPQDGEEEKALTASIYVKHRGILDNPNSLTITKIKRLVSSAIPGLTIDNVSVISDRALYADISLEPLQRLEEERAFASVWNIVVARDSLNRFRLIFYGFFLLVFLLACACAWILWKVWPLVAERGGIKTILHPHQYTTYVSLEGNNQPEDKGGGGEE